MLLSLAPCLALSCPPRAVFDQLSLLIFTQVMVQLMTQACSQGDASDSKVKTTQIIVGYVRSTIGWVSLIRRGLWDISGIRLSKFKPSRGIFGRCKVSRASSEQIRSLTASALPKPPYLTHYLTAAVLSNMAMFNIVSFQALFALIFVGLCFTTLMKSFHGLLSR